MELYYWPGLQGRGEFVRLLLEDAGLAYDDVARRPESEGGGIAAVMRMRDAAGDSVAPFAPPILRADDLVIAQTAVVCEYVAIKCALAPTNEAQTWAARQHMQTLLDIVDEVHDTHHPISTSLTYEQQREAAMGAAQAFLDGRLQLRLAYCERVIAAAGSAWMLGPGPLYPDFALFQLMSGLDYAFPQSMVAIRAELPLCTAVQAQIAARVGIKNYLESDRRVPFNSHGIFRHYPELDKP
jgi:glutathione S-transferase